MNWLCKSALRGALPRGWVVALILLGSALAWDASGLDLVVMRWLADGGGFAWRHQWWLERVLHDAARQLSTLILLALLTMVWLPVGPWRVWTRWQRAEVASGTGLALAVVNAIKRQSLTSCPWDLQDFGGTARYVSHWAWGVVDGGPGHCFPGGHASAAFALWAVALPWLASAEPSQQAWGRRWLWGVSVLGLLFGLTQTLRGAHYPSHTWWTAVICWVVAQVNHSGFQVLRNGWLRSRSKAAL